MQSGNKSTQPKDNVVDLSLDDYTVLVSNKEQTTAVPKENVEILTKVLSSLLYGRIQAGEKHEHPVSQLVSQFTLICDTVYSNLLKENGSAYN